MDQDSNKSDPRPVMKSEPTVLRPSVDKSSNENYFDFKMLEVPKEINFGCNEISGPSIKLEKNSGKKDYHALSPVAC